MRLAPPPPPWSDAIFTPPGAPPAVTVPCARVLNQIECACIIFDKPWIRVYCIYIYLLVYVWICVLKLMCKNMFVYMCVHVCPNWVCVHQHWQALDLWCVPICGVYECNVKVQFVYAMNVDVYRSCGVWICIGMYTCVSFQTHGACINFDKLWIYEDCIYI